MKIVIVGNGIAGNQVAFSLVQQGSEDEISIISAENVPEYDPCSLPYFLGGEVEKTAVFRKKPEDYGLHRINLVFNNKVTAIDAETKHIQTDKGKQIPYDKLVLAHGGQLFVPPIEGIRSKGVFSCKQLLETEKLNSHTGSRAVVVGSGAIGIEVAEALKRKGYEVYIIELMDWIMPTLFDSPTAERLKSALESYGIHVCTGEKVLQVKGGECVTGVVTDQRELECDTVVVATGVIPGTKLAQTAGIETNRGILVNAYMQTSVPDIYACGDCVETVDAGTGEAAVLQLKHNALEQGRIVADHISGKNTIYRGAHAFARAHFFKTHAATFGKTLNQSQNLPGEPEVVEKETEDSYLRIILMDGKIIGGQAIGKYAETVGLLISAMRRKEDINQLRDRWTHIAGSNLPHLTPKLRLGHILGF